MKRFAGFAMLLAFVLAFAALPSKAGEFPHWVESYGTSGWVEFYDAVPLDDGFIVVGRSAKNVDSGDALVMKVSGQGVVEWARVYGGPDDDFASGVTIGPNGDIIVVGATKSFGAGDYDLWVLRLYPDGGIRWQKTYGGPGDDRGMAVGVDPNGKIIAIGGTTSFGNSPGKTSDLWVLRLSGMGDVIWAKAYGSIKWDWGTALLFDERGNIYIGGVYFCSPDEPYSLRGKGGDGWVIKLSSSGDVLWNAVYGGPGNEWISDMALLPEGELLLAGATNSFGAGSYDFWVLGVSESEVKWVRTYGGRENDSSWSLLLRGSTLVIGGYTESFGELSPPNGLIVASSIDDGAIEWVKSYEGPGEDYIKGLISKGYGLAAWGTTSSFAPGVTGGWLLNLPPDGSLSEENLKTDKFKVASPRITTYQVEVSTSSPNISPITTEPEVSESAASPVKVSLKSLIQYYEGEPPKTATSKTSKTRTSTTTTTTTSTTTVTKTTTTTTTTTTTSTTTNTATKTASSTPITASSPSPTSEGEKGGICGPGVFLLLGVGVLVLRRRK